MPDLPDPPWRVLAIACDPDGMPMGEPTWWLSLDGGYYFCGSWYLNGSMWRYHLKLGAIYLTVVSHPLNDPQAVAIIEAARTAQGERDD